MRVKADQCLYSCLYSVFVLERVFIEVLTLKDRLILLFTLFVGPCLWCRLNVWLEARF